jgi:hypothetical protein
MPNPSRNAVIPAGQKVGTVKLTVDIRPGPTSQAQKEAWRKFWHKLIAEEVKND